MYLVDRYIGWSDGRHFDKMMFVRNENDGLCWCTINYIARQKAIGMTSISWSEWKAPQWLFGGQHFKNIKSRAVVVVVALLLSPHRTIKIVLHISHITPSTSTTRRVIVVTARDCVAFCSCCCRLTAVESIKVKSCICNPENVSQWDRYSQPPAPVSQSTLRPSSS